MANVSKLHRPGRGRPPKTTWRDIEVQIIFPDAKRIVTTTAVCKNFIGRDRYPEIRNETRWEFRIPGGATVVLRRPPLPREPDND